MPAALLVLMVGLTLLAGHLFVPDGKGLLFWSTMLLLVMVETAMMLGSLLRVTRGRGGATGAILWSWLGVFFLVALGLILLKAALGHDLSDGAFGGLILGATVLLVVVFSALTLREDATRSEEMARDEVRGEEQSLSKSLRGVLIELNALACTELEEKQVRDRLVKALEVCASALEHAQGNLAVDVQTRTLCTTAGALMRTASSAAAGQRAPHLSALLDVVSQLKSGLALHGIL
jgi:hypothetical protein